jgi:hypothetical protein
MKADASENVPPAQPTEDRPRVNNRLPKTVVGLGLVSLFTDVSSEAIFPLLPVFLTTLGASNAFIGLIEGAADLVANILKYLTGVIADRRTRLKPLILVGYGISTVVRPLVAFALAPWHVLAMRVGDRIGKGVRTSPRDALAASTAFGVVWDRFGGVVAFVGSGAFALLATGERIAHVIARRG